MIFLPTTTSSSSSFLSILFLIVVAPPPRVLCTPTDSRPLVHTSSAPLLGFYPHESVSAFLGVPYAQPPIGPLRFRAPRPILAHQSFSAAAATAAGGVEHPLDATTFGPSCIQWRTQSALGWVLMSSTGESEDCLTLNVWVPSTALSVSTSGSGSSSGGLKPVYIWLYGGSFNEGGSSIPLYSGLNMVKEHQDIIVVTVNYRLNFFGFANSPAVPEKNVGLRDQRLAVEWVRDNIAAFGGDPNRMVLGGESAGGVSTSAYSYTYADDPIVRGFISQSGQTEYLSDILVDTGSWAKIANSTGCATAATSTDPEKELECMQAADAFTLRRYLSPWHISPITDPAPTMLVVDNDTFSSVKRYEELGANGKFAKLPVLRGSNNNEADIMLPFTPDGQNNTALGVYVTDLLFTCPVAKAAAVWAANRVPGWRYRLMGEWPSVAPYPWIRAFHTSEIPLIFGNIETVQVQDPSPFELAASKYMQNAWVAFIKDPQNGLTEMGWPVYDPNGTTLVELFANNTPGVTIVSATKYDAACAHWS